MTVNTASYKLYERAKKVMPGGCSRNTILRKPHPIYAAEAHGCYLTDVEGVMRLDLANNVASLIHGHSYDAVVNAVSAQLSKGTAYTVGTEIEVAYAEQLVERCGSFESIRFVNSGTEAVMSCIKAARAFTGKSMIAKVEGSYHGLYDYAEVSQTASPATWGELDSPSSVPVSHGTPQSALDDVLVIPFNDTQRALAILEQRKDELAGVLLDLLPHRIGVIPASEEFVNSLRKWSTDNNALLIFDEVITFRTNFDGAQGSYSAQPDLTALGKMIGGGFPIGAITGRAQVMEVMNPLNKPLLFPHYGTFSANPVTLTAGSVAMERFDQQAVIRLNKLANLARESITEAIKIADVPACVTGAGSMFRVHFKEVAPTNYRTAYMNEQEQNALNAFLNHVFDEGLLMIETGTGFLSTAMTAADISYMSEIMLNGFRKVKLP